MIPSYIIDHLDDQFILIDQDDLTNQTALREKIIFEYPKKTFYIDDDDVYELFISPVTSEVTHSLCEQIFPSENIQTLIDQQGTASLVVRNHQGEILGFINFEQLARDLLLKYLHLQAYTRTLIETVNDAVTIINQDQKIVAWSKETEKIYSMKKEDVIGKDITDFIKADELKSLKTLANGESLNQHKHYTNDRRAVLINSNPVFYNNEIIGAITAEKDITRKIKLTDELYYSAQKLFTLEDKYWEDDNYFKEIRGNSALLNDTFEKTRKAAKTDANILILGESGVGKELFARAIHRIRFKKDVPFIAINCGAIPADLFESEMFGYEKGAFSGASHKGKKGKIELANGGTLFLDEIGEMPLDMQVKVLRLIQEKTFYSVGGTKEKTADFRVIAATNQNLEKMIDEGAFREDLYYRLNVVNIDIPPLRDRPEDVIELTHYFIKQFSVKYSKPINRISRANMKKLLDYDWPGNIRELKNKIEKFVIFSENGEIRTEDVAFADNHSTPKLQNSIKYASTNDEASLTEKLEAIEKELILTELKIVNGNKLACAKNLKISRSTLYNRLDKLGIEIN